MNFADTLVYTPPTTHITFLAWWYVLSLLILYQHTMRTLVVRGTKGRRDCHPSTPFHMVTYWMHRYAYIGHLRFRLIILNALLNLASLLKYRMIHRVDSLHIGLSASFFANLTFIVLCCFVVYNGPPFVSNEQVGLDPP